MAEVTSAFGVFIVLCLYFIPTIVACSRHHRNHLAIGVTNLFFGWTFLGFVIALIWACTDNVDHEARTKLEAGHAYSDEMLAQVCPEPIVKGGDQ